jgi:hypothetical protein
LSFESRKEQQQQQLVTERAASFLVNWKLKNFGSFCYCCPPGERNGRYTRLPLTAARNASVGVFLKDLSTSSLIPIESDLKALSPFPKRLISDQTRKCPIGSHRHFELKRRMEEEEY